MKVAICAPVNYKAGSVLDQWYKTQLVMKMMNKIVIIFFIKSRILFTQI